MITCMEVNLGKKICILLYLCLSKECGAKMEFYFSATRQLIAKSSIDFLMVNEFGMDFSY